MKTYPECASRFLFNSTGEITFPSPEIQTLCKQIAERGPREPVDIEAWARRLADDVADAKD